MNPLAYALVGCVLFWALLFLLLPALVVFALAAGILLVLVLAACVQAFGLLDPDHPDRDVNNRD